MTRREQAIELIETLGALAYCLAMLSPFALLIAIVIFAHS